MITSKLSEKGSNGDQVGKLLLYFSQLTHEGPGLGGEMYSAYDNIANRRVTIKNVNSPFQSAAHAQCAYTELKILSCMKHENIVSLLDAVTTDDTYQNFSTIFVILPKIEMDLLTVLHTLELSDRAIRFYVYQLLRGLKYLHSADLVHRFLTPEFIGITSDHCVKLMDYKLIRKELPDKTPECELHWYRAPEVLILQDCGRVSADIWSVGCIMFELYYRVIFLRGSDTANQRLLIQQYFNNRPQLLYDKLTYNQVNGGNSSTPSVFTETNLPRMPIEGCYFFLRVICKDRDISPTATMLLNDTYLQPFHDETDEPSAEPPETFIDGSCNFTVDDWRQRVWLLLQEFAQRKNLNRGRPDTK